MCSLNQRFRRAQTSKDHHRHLCSGSVLWSHSCHFQGPKGGFSAGESQAGGDGDEGGEAAPIELAVEHI